MLIRRCSSWGPTSISKGMEIFEGAFLDIAGFVTWAGGFCYVGPDTFEIDSVVGVK